MPRSLLSRSTRRLCFALTCALAATTAHAFPPAPFHTIYGTVRDEQGQTLRVAGAVVVFYKNGSEVLRQTITEGTQLDQNYQIRLRMDMLRGGTVTYSNLANVTGTTFTLGIIINNITYFPIEMSAAHTVGKPGERVRLDLTLGTDSDGDGIPDAWEESQLYAAGILPDQNGWNLALIDRDGDFDHDGRSNYAEYIAGTFATDPSDFLSLRIAEKFNRSARLRFFAIYGKRYALESSNDLKTWSAAPLYLTNPDPDADDFTTTPAAQSSLLAATTGLVDIFADATTGDTPTFYRLTVR